MANQPTSKDLLAIQQVNEKLNSLQRASLQQFGVIRREWHDEASREGHAASYDMWRQVISLQAEDKEGKGVEWDATLASSLNQFLGNGNPSHLMAHIVLAISCLTQMAVESAAGGK